MRLRFTIRDLLWLTLVVAMGVGWWLEHRMWTASSRFTIREIPNVLPQSSSKTNMEITDHKTGTIQIEDILSNYKTTPTQQPKK
jgi:hypothetical protein